MQFEWRFDAFKQHQSLKRALTCDKFRLSTKGLKISGTEQGF